MASATLQTFSLLVLITTFISCQNTVKPCDDNIINFQDTISSEHILSVENGDTNKLTVKIYFSPVNKSITPSNFFYKAGNYHLNKQDLHYIIFPRKEVIMFCDSVISAYINSGGKDTSFACAIYIHIKKQALEDKKCETTFIDELPTLLDRFDPLIINPLGNDTLGYVIKIRESTTRGEDIINYYAKKKNCDTLSLATNVINLEPIGQE